MIPITVILVPVYLVVTELGIGQFTLGSDFAGSRNANGSVPTATIYVDDTKRLD